MTQIINYYVGLSDPKQFKFPSLVSGGVKQPFNDQGLDLSPTFENDQIFDRAPPSGVNSGILNVDDFHQFEGGENEENIV